MTERVFRATYPQTGNTYEVRFPRGCECATAVCIDGPSTGEYGALWTMRNLDPTYREVTTLSAERTPTELPPTTADLHAELAAYKQFADDIDAAFAKPSPRGLQLDYQHAYDRLRAVVPTKGSEA